MTKTARDHIEALQFIGPEWTDLGPSKPTRSQPLPVSRNALKALVDLKLVWVRTTTFSYWGWHRPSDHEEWGQRIQAKLTEQGVDVKAAHGG